MCVKSVALVVSDIKYLGVHHFSRFLRSGLPDSPYCRVSLARGSSAITASITIVNH